MKTYALIADGRVTALLPETVEVDGIRYGLADRFPPDMLAACVALTAAQAEQVQPGWLYDGAAFTPLDAPTQPAAPRTCAPQEFRLRFTAEERGALTLAAWKGLEAGDPLLRVFLDDISARPEVDLDHPDTLAGMQLIVSAGVIRAERAAEILAA
jgi:hypothetical protein